MKKATLTIAGDNLKELLPQVISEFQNDEHATSYEMGTGIVFMFDQYKRSLSNFAINVILDYSKANAEKNEFTLQCYALGGKDRSDLNIFNRIEKSSLDNFRAHFFGYAERHKCNWQIGELDFG